jgi:enamine deaminase RidA (YjgF/YER057c/UK114 family)
MSQAVVHNKTVYLAGQVSETPKGKSVAEQARDILASVDRLLHEAGTDKTRLLSATVWLTDMATFDEMNRVWEKWVAVGATPARATVLSPQLAGSDYRIEIGIIAAQP